MGVLTGSSMTRRHTASVSTLELKRLCFLPNTTVVGGASKLFSRLISFAQQNGYNVINSYCDMRYGNPVSPVYEKIGSEEKNLHIRKAERHGILMENIDNIWALIDDFLNQRQLCLEDVEQQEQTLSAQEIVS